jgi:hypothetical protein
MAALASSATGSAGYVWEDPGDSIMVQVSLDLVERLGAAVQQGLGPGLRGVEIGGILLGRMLPGVGRAVLIEDFEPVSCEHLRGASYTLSPKDRRLLGVRLARRGPRQVVGYFRSHTRPGMYLDQDDFTVFSQYFSEMWQVFLLVAPAAEGAATGGFFFWEEGDVNRRSPYRQFPFDSAQLAAGGFPITGGQPAVAPAVPAPRPVRVQAPNPPKPEVARPGRKLPPLPWVVVPVIACLFLIAGLFVSGNQEPAHVPAVVKSSPPVEPLLPEPDSPSAATPQSTPATSQAIVSPAPAAPAPAVNTSNPAGNLTPKLPRKPQSTVLAPLPTTAVRAVPHAMEQPPALAAPVQLEAKFAPVLPRVNTAPPLEAEVSYEPPHPGVFRRALHKIEGAGGGDSAESAGPAPIRKVAPMKPIGTVEGSIVDVKVFIDDAGNVTRAQALEKGGELTGAALNAARQWRFTPARKHNKPVSSEMLLHFRF